MSTARFAFARLARVWLLAGALLGVGLPAGAVAQPRVTILLPEAIRFHDPALEPQEVPAGLYRVSVSAEGRIALVSIDGGPTHSLRTEGERHDQDLSERLAVAVPEDGGVLHVVVLEPDGRSLLASGVWSDVGTRAGALPRPSRTEVLRYASEQRQRIEYQRIQTGPAGATAPQGATPLQQAQAAAGGGSAPGSPAEAGGPAGPPHFTFMVPLDLRELTSAVTRGILYVALMKGAPDAGNTYSGWGQASFEVDPTTGRFQGTVPVHAWVYGDLPFPDHYRVSMQLFCGEEACGPTPWGGSGKAAGMAKAGTPYRPRVSGTLP